MPPDLEDEAKTAAFPWRIWASVNFGDSVTAATVTDGDATVFEEDEAVMLLLEAKCPRIDKIIEPTKNPPITLKKQPMFFIFIVNQISSVLIVRQRSRVEVATG